MSDTYCLMKRAGPILALLLAIMGMATLAPVTVWAGSYTCTYNARTMWTIQQTYKGPWMCVWRMARAAPFS
jgi:hypothetical protein